MIQNFKDNRTRRLFEGERVSTFQSFARQAEKRLRVLDAADSLEALMRLPSNRFKALGGDRSGRMELKVEDNRKSHTHENTLWYLRIEALSKTTVFSEPMAIFI